MTTLRAGELDRLITLQTMQITIGEHGQVNEAWVDIATVWAQVEPLRGEERFLVNPGQEQGKIDTRFKIRYRSDVRVHDHILYDDHTFDIEAVLEIGRREGLEILAAAVAVTT